jgi:hypothetical protein
VSTRAEVAQAMRRASVANLKLMAAELELPAPSAIPAVNAAERDFIIAARRMTAAIDDLEVIPREWRERRSA